MLRRWGFVFAGFLMAGCGGGSGPLGSHVPPLHAVKGQLLLGKEPASGGFIRFTAEKDVPDTIVQADVGPDGRFEVMTIDTKSRDAKRASGAPEGSYRATYYPPNAGQSHAVTSVEAAKPILVEAGANEVIIELPPARR